MSIFMQLREDGLAVGYSFLPEGDYGDFVKEVVSEEYARSVCGKIHSNGDWVSPPVQMLPPASLDGAALIDLCQSAGGMTDAQLVSAHSDPNLAAFWIKLGFASQLLPTDQRVIDGLSAVELLGYLPNGKQAVIDAWPRA